MKTLLTVLLFHCLCLGGMPDGDRAVQEKITIWRAGYPSQASYQYSVVAGKYHFEMVSIGGCTISDSLRQKAWDHNTEAYKKLENINGKGWKDKYEQDVWTMYYRDQAMIDTLRTEPFMKEKEAILEKHGNGLHCFVDSTLSDHLFRINVIGYPETSDTMVSFFRVYMNFPKLQVIRKEMSIQAAPF